jgi:hypothetical protein
MTGDETRESTGVAGSGELELAEEGDEAAVRLSLVELVLLAAAAELGCSLRSETVLPVADCRGRYLSQRMRRKKSRGEVSVGCCRLTLRDAL